MSDRDHYQHSYHGRGGGPNRDSPASNASSSTRRSATLNGGGKNVGGGVGTSNNRNSSPASQGGGVVSGLADDLSHLNLPNEVSVGSVVQCSVANRTYKGEVMAFDPVVKAIVLKSSASCNRTSLNDVHILNLSQLKEVKILQENRDPVPDPPSLNVQRLQNRHREQVDRKRRQVMAFKAGISPEGQRVFQAIGKTIDEIVWNGENIVVMKEVTVTPPYRPENVKGKSDSKALNHVRKIIEKHINDQMSKQPAQEARPSEVVVVNNNNNNNKAEGSGTGGGNVVGGGSGGPQSQGGHQSASRTGSAGRYEDGKSGGRPQRSTGGPRSSTHKREYDQKMYTQ